MARRPAQEIADALRSEILAGNLRPGDQVPSEHELARRFATTRTSAQKAIAALRAEGHLISEHGRGSFVRTWPTIRLLATEGCVFCDHDRLREADLYFENDFCIYSSTRDPRDPPDVIPGCGAIVPKVHRASPFDLTAEEWTATRELLLLARAELHKRLAPDGYTLGWNDQGGLHPHLHVIPRFDDEPMAGHGVRSGIKDPANRRPVPWRPGTGRHMAGS